MEQIRQRYVIRFSVRQRTEHLLILALFIVLALTGFPQKFFTSGWAPWLTVQLGGIDRVRWIHRLSGILFGLAALEHMLVGLLLTVQKRLDLNMVPTKQDFRGALVTRRYHRRLSED